MSNLREFEHDLEAFAQQTGLAHATVMKKLALEIFSGIVKKTPVDTGRARASWTIAISSANRAVRPEGAYPEYQGPGAGALAAVSGQQVLAGFEQLATLTGVVREPIWISNNLPYIEELERGHSGQAPQGMVEVTVLEAELKFEAMMQAVA